MLVELDAILSKAESESLLTTPRNSLRDSMKEIRLPPNTGSTLEPNSTDTRNTDLIDDSLDNESDRLHESDRLLNQDNQSINGEHELKTKP